MYIRLFFSMPDEEYSNVTDAMTSAGAGALAGAGLSATLGGMGLAVGGTALSIGMAPVAAAGAVVGLAAYGILKAVNDDFDDDWDDDFDDDWDDDFDDDWDDDFDDD